MQNKRLIPWVILVALLGGGVATGWLLGEPAPATDPRAQALVEQLGEESYARRQAAVQELESLGEPALPSLRQAASRHADPEVRWRAALLLRTIRLVSRSTDLQLLAISPGEFSLGSPLGEAGRSDDEPLRQVRITQPFLIGKYEVTQEQFEQTLRKNPSAHTPSGAASARITGVETQKLPVENVSWFDALEFCNRLSEADGFSNYYELSEVARENEAIVSAQVKVLGGKGYRLPTEAEWEYCCRAGTTSPFSFGQANTGQESNVKPTTTAGGYGGEVAKFRNVGRTTIGGSYPLNRFGLGDFHGNVAEWCWDWYDKQPPLGRQINPSGPAEGRQRVVRGGSWIATEEASRSASRFWLTPDERKPYLGFRVARSD